MTKQRRGDYEDLKDAVHDLQNEAESYEGSSGEFRETVHEALEHFDLEVSNEIVPEVGPDGELEDTTASVTYDVSSTPYELQVELGEEYEVGLREQI